jgi:hypothetical protein
MNRIVLGIAAAAGLAITLGQVPAAGQLGLNTRPSPFDGPTPAATQKIMNFFLTVPFGLGEVDLSTLGVSSAELATVGPQASASSAGDHMLIVDNDGLDCPNAEYTTIQSAVDAATPGAKIKVCRGVYVEQVVIPASKDDITLFSEGALQAVIKAPPVMIDDKAIVQITGATGVTIKHFTITGPGGGPCDSLRWGVRVDSGGSALISHNHITEIRDTPFSGCQNGIGVLVGRFFNPGGPTPGSAVVVHNLIDKYQKGGVVIDGPPGDGGICCPDDFADFAATTPVAGGSEVAFNIVVGIGATPVIAQNGIQVSREAAANVHHNKISLNNYALPTTVSEGILLFQAGADSLAHHNFSDRNDDGVGIFDTEAMEISYNHVERNDFDGIYAGADTANNLIAHNKAKDNAEHDCHDDTPGAPSLNQWIKDLGRTENKPGLCKGATVVP